MTVPTRKPTKLELSNFNKYLRVQKSGHFNMFDPKARKITGLEKEAYIFVIENYEWLRSYSTEKL